MKIAIFTDTFIPQVNGVARTLKKFTDYLDETEHEYQVFTPEIKESDDLFSSNIHRFSSLPLFLYPECRLAFPNLAHVKQQLKEFKPDIIHITTPFNIGLCGLYYGKKLGIPIVGSYHTNFDQYLKYYDFEILSKWLWKYMNWFHRPFLKTFVPSNDTRNLLLRHGFLNVGIWSRGIDCSLFHPNYNPEKFRKKYNINSRYIFTYVGRLAPEKDIQILMDAANMLPTSIQRQVHWCIVGEGPLREELEASAPANFTFTGYLKGQELAEAYAASDLFTFPSTTETFGNVVLESLACGTPAIVANSGGVKEIVQNDKTGILCKPNSASAFTEAIHSLVTKPTKLKQMSYEAREYALNQSWDSIFSNLLHDYSQVLLEQKGRKLA